MWDTIKDHTFRNRFSLVAYICVMFHSQCAVLFSAITSALKIGDAELEMFSCAVNTNSVPYKAYVEKTCFSIYSNAYNSPVKFNVFVMFSFGSVLAASVIYSIAVGRRVDETEKWKSTNSDKHETPAKKRNNEPGTETLYVFNWYFYHLVARCGLGILFTILQYAVLYPGGFDLQFDCSYPELQQSEPYLTAAKGASVPLSSVTCRDLGAPDKQFWGIAVSVCNGFSSIVAVLEVIYLMWHRSHRSCDSEFIIVYFLGKQYVRRKDEPIYLFVDKDIITQTNQASPVLEKIKLDYFVDVVIELHQAPHIPEVVELTGPAQSTSQSDHIYRLKVLKLYLTPDINYGSNVNLDDMFIDLVIQTELALHRFSKNMDRHEIYDVYTEVPENSIRLNEIKDLFYPNEDTKDIRPRAILALGRPGIGKTVLTRKIMRDWAKGTDQFYRGKIAFFFKFRWFHFETLQNLTLKKFLQLGTELEEQEFENIFTEILSNPQNAIFIFDGLDELGNNLEKFQSFRDHSRLFSNEPTCSMSATFLFIKIVFCNLLKGATVLVTSRPTAVDVYSSLNFDRTVEIIGFTSDKIEKYVDLFCTNHNKADLKPKIWSHITSSSELKNLCFIPVNCFIVCCTLVNYLSDKTNDNRLPTTLTDLYQLALVYFNKHHDRNENEECCKRVNKELQELAFFGMENDQLIFPGEKVNEQMKESGLMHSLPERVFTIQLQVCFIHLTVQEFLAAKHVVETKKLEDIEAFICSHFEHGRWHLVLQFLAGLMTSSKYRHCVSAFTVPLSGRFEGDVCDLDTREVVLWMKCIREMKDENIVKETVQCSVLKDVATIYYSRWDKNVFSPSDLAAVVFVCKNLKKLTTLDLDCDMKSDCFLEFIKLLQEKCMQRVILEHGNLGDFVLEHALSALMKLECHMNHEHLELTVLKVRQNKTSDASVCWLSEFFKNGHGSGLKELHLPGNEITSCGISKLSEALGNEVCKLLTVVNLSSNAIGDEGMRSLCKAVKEGALKVRTLNVEACSLTSECVSTLLEVLIDENCQITNLSLCGNGIGDDGVRTLCCAFEKEQCKLTELDLCLCSLTDECMPCFCEALGDEHCKLTKLDLRHNAFTKRHLSSLADAVKRNYCRIEINNNNITDEDRKLFYAWCRGDSCAR